MLNMFSYVSQFPRHICAFFRMCFLRFLRRKGLNFAFAMLPHLYLFTTFDFRQSLDCLDSTLTMMLHTPSLLHLLSQLFGSPVLFFFKSCLPFRVLNFF